MTRTERRPPCIAVVAYTEYPYDMRIRREAETLARDGHEVHVIATRPDSGPSPGQLGGVHVHELPLAIRRGGKTRYIYQYLSFLLMSAALLLLLHSRHRFDLVHVHSLPDFEVFCAFPLRTRGIPVVLDMHEAMPEILAARMEVSRHSLWFRAAAALEKISGQFANHIIAANDGIKGALVARGMPPSRITAVYNVGDAPANSIDPNELRRELGLPSGRLVVHAGGINPEKDLETVVHAVSMLPPELDVHLVIAGHGDQGYISSLQELAVRRGISSRVFFVGRLSLDRAKSLMSLSSVGLVSAIRNPLSELAWPTRIAEFANLRKPLIVADLRFVRSVLGNSARYYTPGDARGLASEVRGLMTSPAEAHKYALAAERICSKFGLVEMRRNLLEVYRAALS